MSAFIYRHETVFSFQDSEAFKARSPSRICFSSLAKFVSTRHWSPVTPVAARLAQYIVDALYWWGFLDLALEINPTKPQYGGNP